MRRLQAPRARKLLVCRFDSVLKSSLTSARTDGLCRETAFLLEDTFSFTVIFATFSWTSFGRASSLSLSLSDETVTAVSSCYT